MPILINYILYVYSNFIRQKIPCSVFTIIPANSLLQYFLSESDLSLQKVFLNHVLFFSVFRTLFQHLPHVLSSRRRRYCRLIAVAAGYPWHGQISPPASEMLRTHRKSEPVPASDLPGAGKKSALLLHLLWLSAFSDRLRHMHRYLRHRSTRYRVSGTSASPVRYPPARWSIPAADTP